MNRASEHHLLGKRDTMAVKLAAITTEAQVEALIPLVQEIWREWYSPIIGTTQVDYMLREFQSYQEIWRQVQGDVLYFFIEVNGQAVGYTAYELSEDRLFISKLYLLASQRGQGYASQVFTWLEKQAIIQGKKILELHVNQDNQQSIEVYEGRGFKNSHELVSDIGEGFQMVDYVFEKQL
ncbi:GNAT family N-acetyltransferase [Vagococcus sp. BWB3-3]|uniref:GNAT family N-acetyltransferase n=1 Tax=Vagococcus allomyrinae TaxID=2794353 RepID=A0A940PGM7_9ENTE|nr:GNAT family N-acetyltransferase [Vagococcus allomyrinae]MBP1044499.1 GNAT family N-acetyltransferase [Vagococcus allomyrinae]